MRSRQRRLSIYFHRCRGIRLTGRLLFCFFSFFYLFRFFRRFRRLLRGFLPGGLSCLFGLPASLLLRRFRFYGLFFFSRFRLPFVRFWSCRDSCFFLILLISLSRCRFLLYRFLSRLFRCLLLSRVVGRLRGFRLLLSISLCTFSGSFFLLFLLFYL